MNSTDNSFEFDWVQSQSHSQSKQILPEEIIDNQSGNVATTKYYQKLP